MSAPPTSDQHWFMKGIGKYLPYGDASAEFHDGLFNPNNALSIEYNTWTNVPTMFPSYLITVLADMNKYKLQIFQYKNMKDDY